MSQYERTRRPRVSDHPERGDARGAPRAHSGALDRGRSPSVTAFDDVERCSRHGARRPTAGESHTSFTRGEPVIRTILTVAALVSDAAREPTE